MFVKEIEDYKHLKEIDGIKLTEYLYINNFPRHNKKYKSLLIQILRNIRYLYIDNNIIFNTDRKTELIKLSIPLADPITGMYMDYELVKKFKSVENVYELRYPLGKTIHPRWIFVPLDKNLPTIIFSYFFEKVTNDFSSDYTQVSIEETQRIFDEMLNIDSYHDYLGDGV